MTDERRALIRETAQFTADRMDGLLEELAEVVSRGDVKELVMALAMLTSVVAMETTAILELTA